MKMPACSPFRAVSRTLVQGVGSPFLERPTASSFTISQLTSIVPEHYRPRRAQCGFGRLTSSPSRRANVELGWFPVPSGRSRQRSLPAPRRQRTERIEVSSEACLVVVAQARSVYLPPRERRSRTGWSHPGACARDRLRRRLYGRRVRRCARWQADWDQRCDGRAIWRRWQTETCGPARFRIGTAGPMESSKIVAGDQRVQRARGRASVMCVDGVVCPVSGSRMSARSARATSSAQPTVKRCARAVAVGLFAHRFRQRGPEREIPLGAKVSGREISSERHQLMAPHRSSRCLADSIVKV
jgi:hypothetical protein